MKIINVRVSAKEDKVLVILSREDTDKPVFLTDKQIASATGIKANFNILKGSDIDVSFFNKGEKLSNGTDCTKDETIIKDFSFELAPQLQQIATVAAFGMSMF